MPEKLKDLLDRRAEIEMELRRLSEDKGVVEHKVFKELLSKEMEFYLSINWKKLYNDLRKGLL